MALPNDDIETKTMTEALIAAGANLDVALPAAIDAFAERGEWTNETAGTWVARAKAKHPEFFVKPPTEADLANAELERQAFTGKGDASARAKLVKTIGLDASNAAAVRWNLRGVGDFTRKGTAPLAAGDDKTGDDKTKDKSTNAWRLPPGPEGDRVRAKAIAQLGSRVCAGLARAAGVDLGGRPLRAE